MVWRKQARISAAKSSGRLTKPKKGTDTDIAAKNPQPLFELARLLARGLPRLNADEAEPMEELVPIKHPKHNNKR
jgi:hypothetical protein